MRRWLGFFQALLMLVICGVSFESAAVRQPRTPTSPLLNPASDFPDHPEDPLASETVSFSKHPILTAALAGKPAAHDLVPTLPAVTLVLTDQRWVPGVMGRPDTQFLTYRQMAGGILVDKSYVQIAVRQGFVVAHEERLFPQSDLESLATGGLSAFAVGGERTLLKFIAGTWRKVSEGGVAAEPGLPSYIEYIDLYSGEIFRRDARQFVVTGNIQGRGALFDPFTTGGTLNFLNLPDLNLLVGPTVLGFTDASGNYSVTLPADPSNVTFSLNNGRFTRIIADQGTLLSTTQSVADNTTTDFLFNPSGNTEFDTSQVQGFYHVNVVHAFLTSEGITAPGFGNPLATHVNQNDVCNAFFDPAAILTLNFFAAGTDPGSGFIDICANSAYDTIVYHEYGHYVDHLIGGIDSNALSEGIGDTLAFFVSQQPLMGENFFLPGSTEPHSYIRNADNTVQYPVNGAGEPHLVGQSYSGFTWDLREALQLKYGAGPGEILARNIILHAMFSAQNIPNAAWQTLVLDDDDADLSNGTPDEVEIQAAADAHSIPLASPTPVPPHSPTPTPPPVPHFSGSGSSGGGGCQQGEASVGDLGGVALFLAGLAALRRKKATQSAKSYPG